MKHTIDINLPRLFPGKKKKQNEIKTEIGIEDVYVLSEDKIKEVCKTLTPLAITLILGYSLGYTKGLKKGVSEKVIVLK